MGCEWQRQHIRGLKATQMIFCNYLSSLFGHLEWQNGFIEPVYIRCSRFQLGSTSKQTCCQRRTSSLSSINVFVRADENISSATFKVRSTLSDGFSIHFLCYCGVYEDICRHISHVPQATFRVMKFIFFVCYSTGFQTLNKDQWYEYIELSFLVFYRYKVYNANK